MNEPTGRSECDAFAEVVQSVLDGDRPAGALAAPHAANCDDCRALAESAQALAAGIRELARSIVPPDFAARVVPAALAERRRERFGRRAMATTALAASVLFAIIVAKPWAPDGRAVAERETVSEPPVRIAPPVEDSLREAGSAFVSLTKRTAAETFAPARNLLAGIELPDATPPAEPPKVEAASMDSPIAPITNTARRAINLFIRDVGGLAPSSNRKS
jgi:hypothetical protein